MWQPARQSVVSMTGGSAAMESCRDLRVWNVAMDLAEATAEEMCVGKMLRGLIKSLHGAF